jgi:PAS domain S-box-containing protein
MKQATRSPLLRYGVAMASSLIAVAVTQTTVLQTGSPFLLAIAAILISAWYGGLGPGLTATVISLLTNIYLILGPSVPLRFATLDEAVRLVVFAFIALFIIWFELVRERTEVRLRAQGEFLRITLSSIGDAVITTNAQGQIVFMNPIAQVLIGWTQEQVIGKPLGDVARILNETDGTQVQNPIERVIADGTVVGLGNFSLLITRNGSCVPIDNSAAPIRNDQGEIIGVVLVMRDISERRRAEQGLARLAAIVESSEDAIVSKTLNGIITSWNPGATRLFGYSAEQVIGKSVLILYPPERQDEFRTIMERLGRSEPVPLHDTERIRQDGSRIKVSVSISLIKNSAGQVIGASTIARDITQRKHAEESQRFLSKASNVLASSLDYQETLASVTQLAVPEFADWCGVNILQDNGELAQVAIAHINPEKIKLAQEMQRHFPPDPNALYGIHNVLRTGKSEFAAHVTDEQIAAAARDDAQLKMLFELGLKSYIIAPLIARGRTLGTITFVSSRTERRYTPADVALAEELARRAALSVDNARLYRDAQRLNEELEQRVISRTLELQSTNRNLESQIKERKQAYEQLRLLSAHLQSAREEERVRIAREIHDELGQVLTAIKIDVSLLGEKLADKATTLERATMVDEINSTIRLIDQTIRMMRHIIQELRPEILDHLGLVAAIEWQVQEFQSRTGIECEFSPDVDDSHLDLERSTATFRILQEALTNVARHAQASQVEINLNAERGKLVLEIRDNGKGITPGELTNQKSFGILGMRERAFAFGGDVGVLAAPSHGTIVRAEIPV